MEDDSRQQNKMKSERRNNSVAWRLVTGVGNATHCGSRTRSMCGCFGLASEMLCLFSFCYLDPEERTRGSVDVPRTDRRSGGFVLFGRWLYEQS